MATKKAKKRPMAKEPKSALSRVAGGGAAFSKIEQKIDTWAEQRKDKKLYDAASGVAVHRFNADTNINKGDNWLGPVIGSGTPTGQK